MDNNQLPPDCDDIHSYKTAIQQLTEENQRLRRQISELKAQPRDFKDPTESETRLRDLIAHSSEGILVVDEQGLMIFWNSGMEKLTGVAAEDVLHKTFWDVQYQFLPSEQKTSQTYENLITEIGNYLKTGQSSWADQPLEQEYVLKDGTPVVVGGRISAIPTPKGFILISISRDITSQKRAEEVLKLNDIRQQLLLELHNYMDSSQEEILDFVVQASQKSLQSKFAFLALLNTAETEMQIIATSNHDESKNGNLILPRTLPVTDAGLWGECVRQRKPVIFNNCDGLDPSFNRSILEEVDVDRFLSVPIFDSKRLVMVGVVINKANPYSIDDSNFLTALLERTWGILRRKQVEEALRESEVKHRVVADNTYDWEFWQDPLGNFIYNSPSSEHISGYTSDEFRADPTLLSRIIHPEDRLIFKGINEKLKLGIPFNEIEFRIIRKDGQIIWIGQVCQPVSNDQGVYLGIRGSNRDISERKLIENALQVSEQNFRQLVNTLQEGIWRIDQDSFTTYANPRLAEMLGYSVEELIGKHLFDFMDENGKKIAMQNIIRTLEGIKEQHEFEFIRKDGSQIFAIMEIGPVIDEVGNFCGVIAGLTDTTHRKKVEEDLKKSYLYNRSLIEASLDPLVTIGQDGKITDVNTATEHITGCERSEMIGTDFSDYFSEPEKAKIGYQTVFREGFVRDYPLEIVHKNDSITSVLYNATLYKDETGNPIGVFAAARDITELKKAQDALQKRNEELEFIVQVSSRLRFAHSMTELLINLFEQTTILLNPDLGVFLKLVKGDWMVDLMDDRTPDQRFSSIKGRAFPDAALFKHVMQSNKDLYSQDVLNIEKNAYLDTLPGFLQEATGYVLIPVKTITSDIGLFGFCYLSQPEISVPKKRLVRTMLAIAGNALSRVELMETLENRVESRTRELNAMYQLTSLASKANDSQTMLRQTLLRILENINGQVGDIHIIAETDQNIIEPASISLNGEVKETDITRITNYLTPLVIHSRAPVIISNRTRDIHLLDAHLQYCMAGFPIQIQGKIVGILSIMREIEKPFNTNEVSLLSSISEALGVIVENIFLRTHSETVAVIKERERLARELHDSVTQSLYGLTLFAKMGSDLITAKKYQEAQNRLKRISETAQQALKEMRLMIYQLRPLALEQEGLIGALQKRLETVEKRGGMDVELDAELMTNLAPAIEESLYHIALEALNNALKHSNANAIKIALHDPQGKLELAIEDNGVGFDLERLKHQSGLGITNMTERAQKIGCIFKIITIQGKGTRVVVTGDIAKDLTDR